MWKGIKLCGWALCIVGLARCGDDGPRLKPTISPEQREYALSKFVVLDGQGYMAPSHEPSTNKTPFGVLIYFPLSREESPSMCTVSHIARGRVLTNSHCLPSRKAEDYFVFFFDSGGSLNRAGVRHVLYRGSLNMDDIGVLEVGSETDSWDIAEGEYWSDTSEIGARPPKAHSVQIWAYDPIGEHPQISLKWPRTPGAVFHRRSCVASRTMPEIKGIKRLGGGLEVPQNLLPAGGGFTEKIHAFIDQCDAFPVHGNSGSLMTLSEDFNKRMGVLHWVLNPKPEDNIGFVSISYRGNNGMRVERRVDDKTPYFAIASTFDLLLSEFPGVLNP